MKKYNLAIVGTFDCENYGDLMFPVVFKKQIEKRLSLDALFLFSPNSCIMPLMPEEIKVYSVGELESVHREYKIDAIIFGGGDLVRFDSDIAPTENYRPLNTSYDLMVYTAIAAAKMNIPIIWNAPGVPFGFSACESELIKELVDNLLDYCAVRDKTSADLIEKCGVSNSVSVVPDTVFSLSDVIDSNNEFGELSREFDFLRNDYIVFQSMPNYSDEYISSIAYSLREISKVSKVKAVFLPIGYVHNDDQFIKKFLSVQNDPEFFSFNRKLNVFETTAVLANAKAFIGSSLHGNIVSNSYGVPNIGLDLANLVKLRGFFKMQGRERYCIKDISNLVDIFSQVMTDPGFSKIDENKALINEHFDRISEIIKNSLFDKKEIKNIFDLSYRFFPSCNEEFVICFYGEDGFEFSDNRYVLSLRDIYNELDFEAALPNGTKSVRIHPTLGSACIIEKFSLIADDCELGCIGNYYKESLNSDAYVFLNTNPELVAYVPFNTTKIRIKCLVFVVRDFNCLPQNVRLFIDSEKRYLVNGLASLKDEYNALFEKNEALEKKYELIEKDYKGLNDSYSIVSNSYNEIVNSFYWRITVFPRTLTHQFKRIIKYLLKCARFLKHNGLRAVINRVFYAKTDSMGFSVSYTITKERRTLEENHKFARDIKISILVPLYNTPKDFLAEMIESVQNQTYRNFELCLADGSDKKHSYVGKICARYEAKDKRIVYRRLTENKGISENTNECIKMATGEYIALFDHDDILHPSALYECMRAICEQGAEYVYTDEATFLEKNLNKIIVCHFKSDYAIDTLLANNYICHFSVFKASLIEKAGYFRHEYDGSQDHDMILRLTDAAEKIVHIPKILYFWRSHANSVAMDINSKSYAIEAGKRAVHDFLESKGLEADVSCSPAFPTIYKIDYKIKGSPLISIIIPTKDNLNVLRQCIDSVLSLTRYENYELVLVDNGSTDFRVYQYYEQLKSNPKIKIIAYNKPFNYSLINNFAVNICDGDYVLFLNNDTKVITDDWIEQLLMYAQRDDVGAVGAKLLFPDNTIQHGGIVLGLGADRIAGHSHYGTSADMLGYMGKMYYTQNVSAVTAACLMVKKSKFDEVGGFDERLAVAFNDVDFCLKLRKKGYLNVFNPFCKLFHYESKTRGSDQDAERRKRFLKEKELFLSKWKTTIDEGDPYYNPNFSLDFSYEIKLPIEN